jgi:hypothetical protein
MDKANAESLERMSDHASTEYQRMYNYSIFSFDKSKFYGIPDGSTEFVYDSGSFVVNADYEKVPTYGLQLMLKVKIANKTYAYMVVTPSQWDRLPDSGNIVVNVTYSVYGASESKSSMFITDITEVDTSATTVNPEDSATNLDDLISSGSSGSSSDGDDSSDSSNGDNYTEYGTSVWN